MFSDYYYERNETPDCYDPAVYEACLHEQAFTCLTDTQRADLRGRMQDMLRNLQSMDMDAFYDHAETAIHSAPHPNGEDPAIDSLLMLHKAVTAIAEAENSLGAAIQHLDSLATYEQAQEAAEAAAKEDYQDAQFISRHGIRAFFGVQN